MKRHNFRGQEASHGVERKHRSPGSIGGHSANTGTGPQAEEGQAHGRAHGRRAHDRSLARRGRIDAEKNLLLVKGPVPGPAKSIVEIREPSRLYTPKARKQAEAGK